MCNYNILTFDSSKRNTSLYPTNNPLKFINQSIHIKKIEVLNAIIPNTTYSISGNVIDITVGITTNTISLLPGSPSSFTFASNLQDQLNALGLATFSVSIDSSTLLLTINCDLSFTIDPLNSKKILGISSVSSGFVVTGDKPVSLNPTKFYNIKINELPYFNQDFIILNDVGVGSIKYFKKNADYPLEMWLSSEVYLNNFTFNIYDENGNLCDFRGSDWLLTMIFYY